MADSQLVETLLGVIASLATVIGTVIGLLNAQYRQTIKDLKARNERLENREDTTLKDISAAITQDAGTTATIAQSVQSIVEFVREEQFKDKYGVRALPAVQP